MIDRDRISAITHGDLPMQDPVAPTKLDALLDLTDLGAGDSALDVGSGPGEVLIRLAERRGVRGVGVDTSEHAVALGRERARARLSGAGAGTVELVHGDAAGFKPQEPFALAACIGSSHALGGTEPALAWLAGAVRSGGWVLLGEGYWRREPEAAYLEALGGASADELTDFAGLVALGEAAGLRAVASRVASEDDWDAYEWGLIANGEAYAAAHPAEPGVGALLAWVDRARRRYLSPGGRDTLGFALVLFRAAPTR